MTLLVNATTRALPVAVSPSLPMCCAFCWSGMGLSQRDIAPDWEAKAPSHWSLRQAPVDRDHIAREPEVQRSPASSFGCLSRDIPVAVLVRSCPILAPSAVRRWRASAHLQFVDALAGDGGDGVELQLAALDVGRELLSFSGVGRCRSLVAQTIMVLPASGWLAQTNHLSRQNHWNRLDNSACEAGQTPC